MSDNGLNIGARGLLGTQNLYTEASRVPLIVAGPRIPRQTNSNTLVYLSDIYPTLVSMLRLKAPSHAASRGIEKAMTAPSFQLREAQYLVYKDVQRAIRTAEWKYIVYHVKGVRTEQLFNLEKIRLNLRDLSADPAFAAKKSELTAMMRKEANQQDDVFVF